MPLRARVSSLVKRHGPRALLAMGVLKGVTVAAAAPLVGAPMGLALVAAALWAGGSGAAALWWTTRARARDTRAAAPA